MVGSNSCGLPSAFFPFYSNMRCSFLLERVYLMNNTFQGLKSVIILSWFAGQDNNVGNVSAIFCSLTHSERHLRQMYNDICPLIILLGTPVQLKTNTANYMASIWGISTCRYGQEDLFKLSIRIRNKGAAEDHSGVAVKNRKLRPHCAQALSDSGLVSAATFC